MVGARDFFAVWILLTWMQGLLAQSSAPVDKVFYLGEDSLVLRMHREGIGAKSFVFFAPHEDERAAAQTALAWIRNQGGHFLELKNTGLGETQSRYVTFVYKGYRIEMDPNRMFTSDRELLARQVRNRWRKPPWWKALWVSERQVVAYAVDQMQALAQAVAEMLEGYDYVIAVHNNWSNKPESYNLSSYFDPCSEEGKNAVKYYYSGDMRVSEFFLVTREFLFDWIRDARMNVVWQVPCPADDGSFSVYAARKGMLYINCEVQRDREDLQYPMIHRLMMVLDLLPR
jgi:hypothetical protein